jgi:fatty-acyl-CoA synthase
MKTITEALFRFCEQTPNKSVITFLEADSSVSTITYRDLVRKSSAYAQMLSLYNITPGDIVIIILPQGVDLVYAFFGTILSGAVPSIMPYLTEKLSPDHYRRSMESLFKFTAPSAVITNQDFLGDINQARIQSTSIRVIITTETIKYPDEVNLSHISNMGLNQQSKDTALLQHSSGTTGLQKGVALSHQAIFKQIESYSQSLQLNNTSSGEDIIVSWLPLYHDMGLIAGFIMPVLSQSSLVLMSPFDWIRAPYKLLQTISKYRGTLSWLPNFAYNFCAQKIRERDLEGLDLSSCRAVINCSEPMYWQSHQQFLERFQPYGLQASALATCYAMAENVFAVTQGGISDPVYIDEIDYSSLASQNIALPAKKDKIGTKMLSAGQPIANTSVQIINQASGTLPERYVGEIAILSDCMLSGYYNRPDLTEASFLDGWFLTGDLGYIFNKELFVTGRKKDIIIVGGKNIYPQDIEYIVGGVSGVHPGRISAFGVFNEKTGTEEVVVVAEVEDDNQNTQILADTIRDEVNRGSDIALRYVKLVERGWLIKTSSGKVARSANRSKYLLDIHP